MAGIEAQPGTVWQLRYFNPSLTISQHNRIPPGGFIRVVSERHVVTRAPRAKSAFCIHPDDCGHNCGRFANGNCDYLDLLLNVCGAQFRSHQLSVPQPAVNGKAERWAWQFGNQAIFERLTRLTASGQAGLSRSPVPTTVGFSLQASCPLDHPTMCSRQPTTLYP
jgi:hypothetical protein